MNPEQESALALEKIRAQYPWTVASVGLANDMKDHDDAVHLVTLRPLTNSLILTFKKAGQPVILKTEQKEGFGEIGNNLAGYAGMPANILPRMMGTGSHGSINYLLMEHCGSPLKTLLSGSDVPTEFIQSLQDSLLHAYESSGQANPQNLHRAWNELTSMSSTSFSFGFMLDRIDRKHGYDTSKMRSLAERLNNIQPERLPSTSYWSAGDLTANHIFFNDQQWFVIDPKPFPWGLPEIDLGRLYAQIDMYTEPWSDTFNSATELGNVITTVNAQQTMAMVESLAYRIRQGVEPNLDSRPFFQLGIAWQNIIGIQARDGSKLPALFQYTEHLLANVLSQLEKHL